MKYQQSSLSALLVSASTAARAAVLELWRAWKASHPRTYRPEVYYMRGPGPKWREKHTRGAPTTAQ
jgi:hypothetical protein